MTRDSSRNYVSLHQNDCLHTVTPHRYHSLMINPSSRSRRLASIIGLAVGDAVGTTVEFMQAGTFAPLTDRVGAGPFGVPAGAWTDDTSMALCLAESLVECGGFDAADQMRREAAIGAALVAFPPPLSMASPPAR